jgi:Phage integrase family
VILTERDGPMTPKAFHPLFSRIGARTEMPFPIHPHVLRDDCGYALANTGHHTRSLQAWLTHRNTQHTVRYTVSAPELLLLSGGLRRGSGFLCRRRLRLGFRRLRLCGCCLRLPKHEANGNA